MKLHQRLAFAKDVRARSQKTVTQALRDTQNEKLVQGASARYEPLDSEGQKYPNQHAPLALKTREQIRIFSAAWRDETDLVGAVDLANTKATADVVVEGRTLAVGVPATHLLFLGKQLEHIRTFVSGLLELPIGQEWTWDPEREHYRSAEVMTQRTEKLQKPIVLLQPTDKHPGQAQMITEDKVVGHWFRTNYHGGVSPNEKREWLARIAKISDAVHEAREKANSVDADANPQSGKLIEFVFSDVEAS